jgi:Phage tail sheath protein.
MVVYGSFPGVKVNVEGGSVSGAQIGREQKYYIVALADRDGDTSEAPDGTIDANEVTQIQSRSDVDSKFGEQSQMAEQYRLARGNGANPNFIFGVSPKVEDYTYDATAAASGTLPNEDAESPFQPILDDPDRIVVTDSGGTELTVRVQFGSLSSPGANEFLINPSTGDWMVQSESDLTIEYQRAHYQDAIEKIDRDILENEFAVIALVSRFEEHSATLASNITSLRTKSKMAIGLSGAEPNDTTADGDPAIDTGAYSDAIEATEGMFMAGPVESVDGRNVIGALGAKIVGTALDDAVYKESISGITGMKQRLASAEARELRDPEKSIIPIKDQGGVEISGNTSTYQSESDWDRTIYHRRIVDLVNVTAKVIAEASLGLINDQDTRDEIENGIKSQLEGLASDGLIKSNRQTGTNFFVEVTKGGPDTVEIDLGVSLYGVVKRVPITITVDTGA